MSETCSIDRVIGSLLKQKRVERGVDSETLSSLLRITEESLLDFECGRQRIDAKILYEICEMLDVPARYFFKKWIDGESCESKPRRALTA